MAKNWQKLYQKLIFPNNNFPEKAIPFTKCTQKTRDQQRTLDNSQRDVPVCVVFLQGVLTVPGLLRPSAGACQGTNLTAKRGPKAPFVAKFGVHLEKKVPCRAWVRVEYSEGVLGAILRFLEAFGVRLAYFGPF